MARHASLRFLSTAPEATRELGRRLGRCLPAGAVLCVDGELGAGKTVFVKGLAEGLEVADAVDSPTFTLMKEYEGRLALYHYDAWMEGRERAFLEGGGEDLLHGRGVAVVEWGSRIEDLLPSPYLRIELGHRSPSERSVAIALCGAPGDLDQPLARSLWASVLALEGIPGLASVPEPEASR